MLILLILIWLVIMAGNAFGDWAGVLGIGAVLVLLAGMFCSGWKKDTEAYGNRVDWWAKRR